MSVDLMLPAAEKITLVLEGIGDDKIRVNSSSLDNPVTILADQGIEIVGIHGGAHDALGLLAEPRSERAGKNRAGWSRRVTIRQRYRRQPCTRSRKS